MPIRMSLPTPSSMTDVAVATSTIFATPFSHKLSLAIAKLRRQQQHLNTYAGKEHSNEILKRKWSKLAYKRRELSLYIEQTYKNLQNIALNMR